MLIVTGSAPAPNVMGSRVLLNHIYFPAGIATELKLDVSDVLLILQFTVTLGLTVTTTFWVLVQPFAVNE